MVCVCLRGVFNQQLNLSWMSGWCLIIPLGFRYVPDLLFFSHWLIWLIKVRCRCCSFFCWLWFQPFEVISNHLRYPRMLKTPPCASYFRRCEWWKILTYRMDRCNSHSKWFCDDPRWNFTVYFHLCIWWMLSKKSEKPAISYRYLLDLPPTQDAIVASKGL